MPELDDPSGTKKDKFPEHWRDSEEFKQVFRENAPKGIAGIHALATAQSLDKLYSDFKKGTEITPEHIRHTFEYIDNVFRDGRL